MCSCEVPQEKLTAEEEAVYLRGGMPMLRALQAAQSGVVDIDVSKLEVA